MKVRFYFWLYLLIIFSQGAVMAEIKRQMDTTYTTPEQCRIEKFRIFSPSMGRWIKTVVVLPPAYLKQQKRSFPVLYALHGMGAPYDTWSEMAPLRETLNQKPIIIVSFDADAASWYLDSPYLQIAGRNPEDTTKVKSLFTTFFFQELIPFLDQHYRISSTQRMLTGFSMGAFGAMHYYLTKPEDFVSVSGLSWAFWGNESTRAEQFKSLLGNTYTVVDFKKRIKELKKKGFNLGPFYLHTGTEDQYIGGSRHIRDWMLKQGLKLEYHESPGGHNWSFWKRVSADIIDFHWRTLNVDFKIKEE